MHQTGKKIRMFFTGVTPGSTSSATGSFDGIWATQMNADPQTDLGHQNNGSSLIWGNPADTLDNMGSNGSSNDYRPLCRYFLQGHCSSGSECTFSHVSHSGIHRFARYNCEICSEDILSRGERFGLLENCDHVFCLNCIREWRNQKEKQDRQNLRKCPICRIDSFIIIPSTRFLQGRDKLEERERYRSSVGGIPCKNFNFGKGTCQFGTSCMYLHINEDDNGSSLRPAASVNDFKMILGADGKKTKKQSQLSDFVRLS